VNLHVKGAWMFVAYMGKGLILEGEMDYFFTITVVVDRELSDPVPNVWDDACEIKMVAIIGKGTGTFMDNAAVIALGYTPGDTAKVVVFQVAIFDREIGDLAWPFELVRMY
jgi:hypothetical protein